MNAMNATITARAAEARPGFSPLRALKKVSAFVRNAIKEYGAPYLNGPLPPL